MIIGTVTRRGDDDGNRLRISQDEDGDIHVTVEQNSGHRPCMATVEFCTLRGGGRSMKVRRALQALMKTIEEENEADPMGLKAQ